MAGPDFRKALTCEACRIDYPVTPAFDTCGCGLPTIERELPWGEIPLDYTAATKRRDRLRAYVAHCRARDSGNQLMRDAYQAAPADVMADVLAGFERMLEAGPPPF